MLTKAEVSAVTVGLLGIAPGGFADQLGKTFETKKDLADFLMNTGVFKSMYGENLSNEEFTIKFMQKMLGDTMPQESFDSIVADFTAVLDAGGPRGQFVENAVTVIQTITNDDLQAARAIFNEKLAYAKAYNGNSENLDDLAGVLKGETPTEPDEPGKPGVTIGLTDGRDFITPTTEDKASTDGDDTFIGLVGQNTNGDGAVSNALSTGDFLDGGAGTDKIEATLINDNATHGANQDVSINAITQNIEKAFLSVLDENVIVDGGRMDSVKEFWSDDSDESLVLEDVRLGSKLGITKDITFGMRDVDQQSGLSAAFESQSLINQGNVRSNAQILVEVGDSNKPADSTDPLELIELDLNFTFNGQDYSFDNIRSTDGTYEGLIQGIKNALTEAGLTGLEVTAGRSLSSIQAENDTVPLLYSGATQIIITDPEGTEFTNFTSGVGAAASSKSSNPVSNIDVRDPSVATTMIESNLILDNAGRGSTAGDAVIGGMSNSDKYVEKLNLKVDRDSKIDDLATASGMEHKGLDGNGNYNAAMKGFREIELTSMGANGFVSINDIQDTNTFNANSFQGSSLTIGNADALQTLNASISGNVNVTASTAAGDNVYTTGSGQDVVTVSVDGDDVDTTGEGFALNTAASDDTVTIRMSNAIDTDNGVSFNTMETLDNLSIDTGAGNDTINLNGYGTFDISAGDGSDLVRINSTDLNGDANTGSWTIGDRSDLANNFFDERVLYQAKLTVSFAGFEQTVDVQTDNAGKFIATQETINNAIKAAIDANPELSALLDYTDSTGNQALTISSLIGGTNDLGITVYQPQLVDGAAATDGTNVSIANGDVTALRQGLIKTGFVDNSAGLDNANGIVTATNGTGAASWLSGNGNGANWYGSIDNLGTGDNNTYTTAEQTHDVTTAVDDSTGGILQDSDGTNYLDADAGGSTDSTTGISFAAINAGSGANDVVVMHSNAASANTLVVDQVFGKVSVVNWHDVSANDVNDVAQMGLHALDFSAYLDNQLDDSSNTNGDSAKPAPTVANIVSSAEAFSAQSAGATHSNTAVVNSVNLIRFDSTVTATQGFDGINASTLVAALNDANGDGSTNYGNLNDALLSAAGTNTDLVGTTRDMIIMVENDLNEGEYKVFHVTADNNSADPTKFNTNAVELGTLDFGASVNLNLVGSANYTNYVAALQNALDTGASTFTYVDGNDVTQTVNTPNLDTVDNGDNGGSTGETLKTKAAAFDTSLGTNIIDETAATANDDTISITRAAHIAGSFIEGGDGNDTLVFANSGAYDLTTAGSFSSIETINASNATTLTATAAQLNGVTVTNGTNVTVSGLADKASADLSGINDGATVSATVAATADLSGNANLTTLDNLAVDDGTASVINVTLSAAQANAWTISKGENDTVTVALADNDDVSALDISDADTVSLAGDISVTMSAAQSSASFSGLDGKDSITINTLDGKTVAATAANDTFDFAGTETSVAINGFTSGTDKVDLNDATTAANVTTISSSAQGTMADNTIYYLNTGNAGDADGATAAASAMSAALSDDADIATGSYVVVVDDDSSAIYQVSNSATDADGIIAGDLTLVGTLDTTVADTDIVLA